MWAALAPIVKLLLDVLIPVILGKMDDTAEEGQGLTLEEKQLLAKLKREGYL